MSECNCVDTGHKQDCPLGKDLRIAAMQEEIAILQSDLAAAKERESDLHRLLRAQSGLIEEQRQEIARAREALIDIWARHPNFPLNGKTPREQAEAHYAREVAHAQKGEEVGNE